MRKFIFVLYFLNVIWFEFVFAPHSEENTTEENGDDSNHLNFYVGPDEEEAKNPCCCGNFFSLASKPKKCSDKDVTSFLNSEAQGSSSIVASGADGEVFKFIRPDGKVMAVKKRFKKNNNDKNDFLREVKLLQKCKWKGFTANIECFFKDGGYFYYMMEYLNGKTLEDGSFYKPQNGDFNLIWAHLCLQMATIVERLNSENVLHLDIHMGNWIVASDGRLYIIDFSRAHKSGLRFDKAADALFLGQTFKEIMMTMASSLGNHHNLDWSSLDDLQGKLEKIMGNKVDFKGILEIIHPLLREDPNKRSTVTDSKSALELFLKKHNIQESI